MLFIIKRMVFTMLVAAQGGIAIFGAPLGCA
jgi:hypothetical protein